MKQDIVLPLDKPYGWSSFDAIRYVQKQIKQHFGLTKIKIGHAGTLDPLATGVLLLCIGKATRLIESLQNARKEYLAVLRLGAVTPSFDLETEPIDHKQFRHISETNVQDALQKFTGEYQQMPPVFSAKNIDGKRSYELARKNVDISLKPNTIHIYSIDMVDFASPFVTIKVSCGKGTYIRALAQDIGAHLDCGACLAHLRRTASGEYTETNLCSIDEVVSLMK